MSSVNTRIRKRQPSIMGQTKMSNVRKVEGTQYVAHLQPVSFTFLVGTSIPNQINNSSITLNSPRLFAG